MVHKGVTDLKRLNLKLKWLHSPYLLMVSEVESDNMGQSTSPKHPKDERTQSKVAM